MTRSLVSSALLWLTLVSATAPAQTPGFMDPAPPKLEALPEMAPPQPQAQEGLKFHAAPKPLAAGAVTHDWRNALGPTHNALSTETPLLKQLGKGGPAIVWEVSKGESYASPAVVGERVVLFHRLGDEEVVECLQAETGKRFWRMAYPTAYRDRYGWNGGPRCQPVTDGEFVYTHGVQGKLHCLKLTTGQVLWKRDLVREFKLKQSFFGVGAAPLLDGERLIVNVGAPGGPSVAAFDKRTGKMLWGAGKEWGASYASPVPAEVHGRRRLFVFAGGESRPPTGGLLALDPASGKVDFAFPWRAEVGESVNASSPLIVGNQVYISECYGPGGAMLDVRPDGTARKVWSNQDLKTHFMTAIHKDGYLYGSDGHGPQNCPLVCVELRTGKEMWRHEPTFEATIPGADGPRKVQLPAALASLLLVDGRCLMLGQYGHLAWLDLNPKGFRELEHSTLFVADETWCLPSLSRGLLYVCQNTKSVDGIPPRLICYDLRGAKP